MGLMSDVGDGQFCSNKAEKSGGKQTGSNEGKL